MHKRLIKRHIHVLRMKLGLSRWLPTMVSGYFHLIRLNSPKYLLKIRENLSYVLGKSRLALRVAQESGEKLLKYVETLSRDPRYLILKKYFVLIILVIKSFLAIQIARLKQKFSKSRSLVSHYWPIYLNGSRNVYLKLYGASKAKSRHLRILLNALYIKLQERIRISARIKYKFALIFEDSKLGKSALEVFHTKRLSLKQGFAIASVIIILLLVQTQFYRTRIITERSTQTDFVTISGGSTGDLNFKFDFDSSQRSPIIKNAIKPVVLVSNISPKVVFEDYSGNQVQADYKIVEVGSTGYFVTVTPKTLPPGEYRAKLGVYKDGIYYEQQQRFVYGVLAVNTNKATYLPGETVYMHMAALRNDGHTICDADLDLTIVNPKGVETKLDVLESGKCLRNNVTDVPDYSSSFKTDISGMYKVILSNKLNNYKIEDTFKVVEDLPYSIERLGPTRIYPYVPYDFKIKVKAKEAYQGSVIERVPDSFEIDKETMLVNGMKEIKWDVNLEKDEEVELTYRFDAPDVSPDLYLLGPIEIGKYTETRLWQVAGDADDTVVFTTPGSTSWTVPEGVTSITVETWGAGGGGKGGTVGLPGGGGGGGAYSKEVIAVTPSTSFNAVVGTGGTAGTANGGNGGNGGSSSFSANTTNTTANGGTGATTTSGGAAGSSNVNADLSYAGGAGGNGHQTGVTYVGAASAATTSVTFPSHQKGDLIIIMAFRDGSATLPTIPTGWTVLETSTTTSASSVLAYKLAATSSETSGTWTSATELAVQVYRGHAGVGIWGGNGAVSNSINYPAISLTVTDGTSWVAGFAGHRSATNVEGSPSGMSNRTSAGTEIAGHDTNGGVASWSSANVGVSASSGWLSWVVEVKSATTSSALSYISSATGITSLTMPSHQIGDLLVMFVYRDGSTTSPAIPAGWYVWGANNGANTNTSVGVYKVAKTASETSGTFTGATALEVHVYRGHGGYGAVGETGAASTTVTYPALTMQTTDGSSWVAGFAGHKSINTNVQNAPAGMTNRNTYLDATNEIAGHDTAGGATSWSNTDVSVGGTSSGWRARTVEIKSAVVGFGAGGGASSAGTASAGTAGNNNTDATGGTVATAPTGGGNGGAGGDDSSAGTNGSTPGGAGGGGGNLTASGNAGGAGANGKVAITYAAPVYVNVLGSCKQSDQATNCTDVGTVRVAVNGSLKAQTQATVAGTWTISGVLQPQSGDVITVFIDAAGETDEAVAVTTYDGSGDIDGVELIAQRLSIGNIDNRTITNASLSQYDNGVSGDEDIFHEVDGANDLTMVETGKTLAELYIKTGNTYRPASDNTGNVTVNDFEIPSGGIFTADGNTITITGDATPFVVAGTLNEDTSTFKYSSASTTTITPETYYHLSLQPSAAGGPTYTLGNATFNTRNLVVGDGTNAVTINWTANDPAINVGGNLTLNASATWTKSNSASLTFNGATTPVTLTDNNTTKQDLGKLIIDGAKEVDIGSSITAESMNVTTGDTLDLQSSSYTLKITGSGLTTSRPFIVAGTLTEGTSTVEYTGTSATDIDDEIYYNLNLNQSGTTFTGFGNIGVSNVFTINAGTFNAGSNTVTLSGSSTPFVVTGTFTEGTSTINYTGTSATNITSDTYHNLQVGYVALGSSVTYTLLSGSYTISNDLDVGFASGSGTATLDVNANDATVDIAGDIRINTQGSYSASSNSAAPLTVGGDFTNNGTFTHNNGKVAMDGSVDTTQSILGTMTFYTLEIQTGDREIKLGTTGTKTIGANGTLTMTGTSCENMTRVRSSSATTQATLAVDVSATASVSHVDLQDINLTTKTITAANSVNSGNNSSNWTISANACLGTSTNANPTGSSFQRKVIYDDQNSRYWMFNHDGDEIEIKYSSDEGSTWTNPSTAGSGRLPYDTNDFSVWWKSISTVEYVVVAVVDGGDIKIRQGTLSGTDITWDTDVSVSLNETGTYSNPYVVFDSADHIWVGATYYDSTNYVYKTAVTTQAASTDPSTWTWSATPYQISNNQTNSNVYGTITALSSENMYATFVVNTDLVGCKWDDSGGQWKDYNGDSCEVAGLGASDESQYFNSLENGLVAHWKMDEASWNGTTGEVLDSTLSNYDGTSVNGATTAAAGFGRSGSFAGDNDSINAGDVTELNSATNFSVSQWVYITDVSAQDRLFHKAIDGSNDISIAPYYQTTQRIYFEIGNGSNSYGYWDSTGVISNNTWNQIVAVYDGAGTTNADKAKLFVNGVQRTLTFTGTIPSTTANLATYNLNLGSGNATDYFTGKLDDVRIYNRTVTQEEAKKLYELVPDSVNIDDASDFQALLGAGGQIVRTNSGNLYAFLNDSGNCEVWKSIDGVGWQSMDSTGCNSNGPVAIAVKSDDNLAVVYSDTLNSNIVEMDEYVTSTDTLTGTSVQISTSGFVLEDLSIATDSAGYFHLAWAEFDDNTSTSYVYYRNNVPTLGSTITVQTIAGSDAYFDTTITIDINGLPIVSYLDVTNSDLNSEIGNVNDATSFSLYTVDSDINNTTDVRGVSTAVNTETGDLWMAYVDVTTSYLTLAKHTGATWGSSWTTITTNTNVAYEPSIAIIGNGDIYVFYENDTDDIAYDIYDGSSWAGETVLHTGTFQDVKAKGAFEWNNYGVNKIDYVYSDGTDVYYEHLFLRRSPTNMDNASDFGSIPGGGRQIVRTSTGILYSFVNDGGNCEMWKSEDGHNWLNTDSETCVTTIPIAMAIDSDDDIHTVYSDTASSNLIEWSEYSTSTDTFGTSEGLFMAGMGRQVTDIGISVDNYDVPHVAWGMYSPIVEVANVIYINRTLGGWGSTITVESYALPSAVYPRVDITMNDDIPSVPEITYIDSDSDDLSSEIGNQNNASSFTKHTIDSDINDTADQRGISVVVDHGSGDTWIAYTDSTGYISLANHTGSTWTSNWTTITSKTDVGYEPSLSILGSDLYVFYIDDQDDIVYDIYDSVGQTWGGETILEMHGALQDVNPRWSYINNYDSTGKANLKTKTYYFDNSNSCAAGSSCQDPEGVWTNDANVFDSDFGNYADSSYAGSTSTNYLRASGTNADSLSSTITSVKARIQGSSSTADPYTTDIFASIYTNGLGSSLGTAQLLDMNNTTGTQWGAYQLLTAPGGTWDWNEVDDLEVKVYLEDDANGRIYKVEIIVESTESFNSAEIDYLYSDGIDVFYNRLILGGSTQGVQDTISTGLATGLNKNITTIGQTISTVDYVHLAYVNSSGNVYYDRYDGDWDFTATSLDSDTDNTYLSMSLDTATSDAYLGYIASGNDDIYMKKATYSAGPTWTWGTSTTFKTDASEIYSNYNASYSGGGKLGSFFTLGDLSPYNLDWEVVLSATANNSPTVTGVSVNGGSNINLTENSTVNVSWTATITDVDGQAQISGVTGKLYKSNASGAEGCTNDNNDCYEDASCDLTGCSGNTCTATCTSAVYFHAAATDANSGQSALYWRGWMEATDSHSATGVGFSAADAPDINSLAAVDVVTTIDYGALIPNDNSTQQATLVTNTGNVIIDTELSGDNMCVDYPTCASYSIAVGQQEYSISGFTYGSGTDLTSSDVRVQLNLAKSTTSPANSTANLYWRLGVPAIQQIGVYSGENTLTVVNDNL